MIWTISLPCSRAGERARPTKPTRKHPAKPFPRITRQSPRTFRPGALPRTIRCALFKPSPRGEGGAAVTPRRMRCRWVYTAPPVPLEKTATFPPHPASKACHLLLKEKAAHASAAPTHAAAPLRPLSHIEYRKPPDIPWALPRFSSKPVMRSKTRTTAGKPEGARPASGQIHTESPRTLCPGAFCILLFSSCAFSAHSPASAAGSGSRRSWR